LGRLDNFWSKKIKDNSTFIDPKHGPSGIEYVFVNGKKSVADGMILEEYAGSTIRKWYNLKANYL